VRIVIAEDSVLLREGITRLLAEYGHEVVAQLGDATRLLASVTDHQPDLVIVDVRMPPTHTDEGLRAAVELRLATAGHAGAGAVAVRGGALRDRPARLRHGRRGLPAEGAGGRRARVRRGRVRVADGGTALDPEVVAQLLVRSAPARPARRTHATRARGVVADGAGPVQPRDRGARSW
jgi:CheY-like chemotaxis protein